MPLSREIFIERSDFREDPPADWMRLCPGGEVRLRNAYIVRCDEVVKDRTTGDVVELRCGYHPESLGRNPEGKRRKTTAIQWISGRHAVRAEVRLYGRLFTVANPEEAGEGKTFQDFLDAGSVEILKGCLLEPGMANTPSGERFQFVRHGYFIADAVDSRPASLVFNRIVELKDTYRGEGKVRQQAGGDREKRPARKAATPKGKAPAVGTVSDERVRVRANDPSLSSRYDEYIANLGLAAEAADVLTGDPALADFFDAAVAVHPNAKALANWVANDVLRELKGRTIGGLPFTAGDLADLVRLVDEGAVSTTAARTVFEGMMAGGGKPREIARKLGLDQAVSASDLDAAVDAVLAGAPDKVEAFRAGKTSLLGLFTGQVMKATGGKADPKAVQERIKAKLEQV